METATAISEDPPGAKEKPSGDFEDKEHREENAVSGEVLAKPSERDLEKSPVKDGVAEGFPPPISPWTRDREASLQPVFEETNGVVSMVIPTEVLSDANPLWRCYVVGYFIGDAPHVGSIHATVNRIWANPKNKTKVDVQFIEKNTVLFRIENEQMKGRVLQKKYWHIADIPLVVNEWSPETATLKPDLTSMPMWIDLRGVPSHLFLAKGLKCLAEGVGKFVKLHPSTERCIRLDIARLLVEVNLHKELVERINFQDANGEKVSVKVCYPWLPPKCSVCKAWGHKGVDCISPQVKILKAQTAKGKEICTSESNEIAQVGVRQNQNVVGKLLQELEDLAVQKSTEEGSSSDRLIEMYGEGARCGDSTDPPLNAEGYVEAFVFDRTEQKQCGTGEGTSNGITVSPSRFNVLAVSEDEDELDDIEEGELVPVVTKTEVPRETKRGGKAQQSVVNKNSRKKVVKSRDLR
ncbi:hypothetical protein Bca52824_060257 [Brassica carinata]|uniref:DUF4283 domain-containing protein n=1 Tax=Brassica carinata TaxID=52824 RepID=A0A8X7QX56_BRACI|nr:hypothetical protein Bca52824_060257 [Brassica carinata]